MPSVRVPRRVSLGLILVGLLAAGCKPGNLETPFPPGVDFQPLEPLVAVDVAAWPVATATDPRPQGLGLIAQVPSLTYWGSHARGYLHAPLARVYEALQDPAASYLHNDNGAPRIEGAPVLGVEPFPVSFRVRYINGTPVGPVRYDVTYRAGPLEGTEAAPVAIGQRYQKTWGVESIAVLTGSLVARPVDGAPEVTSVEMVAWLAATTQDQADCDQTLRDLFGNLEAKLASMP